MVVVECTPDKKNIREAITLDNGSIVCTVNSFTSDEYASYDDSNGDDYDSAKRYKVVMNSFIDKITSNYLENTMSLLKAVQPLISTGMLFSKLYIQQPIHSIQDMKER